MKADKKTITATLLEIEGKRDRESFPGMIAGAYALWLGRKNDAIDIEDLPSFLKKNEQDDSIRLFVQEELSDHWDKYRPYITSFDQEILKQIILELVPLSRDSRSSGLVHTPGSVLELVTQLLEIAPGDRVADLGAGTGEFLCHACNRVPEAHYWGDEIATVSIAIAKIRANVLEGDVTFVQEDMFAQTRTARKFDKIFCFPPFGMRLSYLPHAEEFMMSQPASLPKLRGTVSCEWIFALKMLSCLEKGGKAVLTMTPGGLFNVPDNDIRRYLLERQLIEAVILLPSRLLDSTAIPLALVVLSSNNSHVRMINASKLGEQKRRGTELTGEDVKRIISAMRGEHYAWSNMVDCRNLIKLGNMDPNYHTRDEIKFKHQTRFGDIIKEMLRGATLTAADLDKLTSAEPTEFQYLAASSIRNGMIDDELPYLTAVDDRLRKYCLRTNDIILSKIGAPAKVALGAPSAGQNILVNGNLFIIRVNEDVADPCYIKVFLESEIGQACIKRVAVGSIMPNVSVEAIKNMTISLPPLEEQRQIANRYRAKADEIILLRKKLESALNSLGHILDLDDNGRA